MAEESTKKKETAAADSSKGTGSSSAKKSSSAKSSSSAKDSTSAKSSVTAESDSSDQSRHSDSASHHHHSGKSAEEISRRRYRKIISYTFSFILSLFMLMATVCLVALTSLFSESFFYSIINSTYYESVLADVVTEAQDYTIPAEFDIAVLDDVFTVTDVKRDVNGHVTAAFRGYNYSPDLQTENEKLYANVSNYIAESGVHMEDDEDTVIAAYVQEIDKIYLERVKIPGINLIKVAREKVKGAVTFALILLFALSIALIVVLIRLYRHPHQGLRYITYAAGGCTLMSFVLPFGLYLSKVYTRVQVSPEYFYHFVTGYLKQILFSFMQASLIWLVVTITCVVLVYMLKNGMIGNKKALTRKSNTIPHRH